MDSRPADSHASSLRNGNQQEGGIVIEVSKTCRWVNGKGHDRVLAVKAAGCDDTYIVAVAHGLTTENGGDAAQWVVDALRQIGDYSG
jgi:hypothetical protein